MNKTTILLNAFLAGETLNHHRAYFMTGSHRLAAYTNAFLEAGYPVLTFKSSTKNPITNELEMIEHYRFDFNYFANDDNRRQLELKRLLNKARLAKNSQQRLVEILARIQELTLEADQLSLDL